ncbi:MAG: NTP transferase domain-containing protein [Planctomycetota bacterium]
MADSVGGIILAAGQGKRLHMDHPKVLADVMGRPALAYVIAALKALAPARICVVVGHGAEARRAGRVRRWRIRRHVCHAARAPGNRARNPVRRARLRGFDGRILVLYSAMARWSRPRC